MRADDYGNRRERRKEQVTTKSPIFNDVSLYGDRKEKPTKLAHGFRTSFRVWGSEQTNADRAVLELCLAHKIGSATEQAYYRSDLLEKRRRGMEHWADYITQHPTSNVVHLHR